MSAKIVKGYKVTNSKRTRTCGIACKSLSELLTKSCEKFQLKVNECCLRLHDGTAVEDEDYFTTLPTQTCFIILKRGEPCLTGADIIYNALRAVNIDTLKTGLVARKFMEENLRDKLHVLSRLVGDSDARSGDGIKSAVDPSSLSSRTDDPAWFQGLDTSSKTKEAFLRRRCGERMRGYLYKAEKDIKSHESYSEIHRIADLAISSLKSRLSETMNMGHYFDRSDDRAMCDMTGRFNCDGLWNKNECDNRLNHMINPYLSRDQRILFSTWNLDHRIEKSREVIPSLVQACRRYTRNPDLYDINIPYLFSLLFTRVNLRLVHIVCHDKTAHTTAKCNPDIMLIDKSPSREKGVKRKLSSFDDDFHLANEIGA